jgi:hypothetical protein
VGVALFTGLLVAVPAVQPAGASPVRAASSAHADRAGSLAKKPKGAAAGDIQSALLKFAASKLAGFAFSQLGLDKLLGDKTGDQLTQIQGALNTLTTGVQGLKDATTQIDKDLSELNLTNIQTALQMTVSKITTLYKIYYLPAFDALVTYAAAYAAAGGSCGAGTACDTARVKYEGTDGTGGLRQDFLNQFTAEGPASYNQTIHDFLVGTAGVSVMSAYGKYLAKNGNGFLTSTTTDAVLKFYDYWANWEALAAWMLAQWQSARLDTAEFDKFLNDQIIGPGSYFDQEHTVLGTPIPANTVIVLPAEVTKRTDDTTNLPMWGFNSAGGIQSSYWLPSRNDVGVPKAINQLNTTAAGYGFKDWKVPSRAELDALLSRGSASQTARTFIASLNAGPQWPVLDNFLGTMPYIWTTQEAGNPSWTGSPAVQCFWFNQLTGSKTIIRTYTGYVHTAVGPVTNFLSGYPASYQNYNRPMPYYVDSFGKIQDLEYIDLSNSKDQTVGHCDAIMNDAVNRAFNSGATLYATLLATRNTGDVNYLP